MYDLIGGVSHKCRIYWTMFSIAIVLVNLFSILVNNTFLVAVGSRTHSCMIMQTL